MRASELYEQNDYLEQAVMFHKVWKKIKKDCSAIIGIYKNPRVVGKLYRGIDADLPPFWSGVSKPRPEEKGERREEVDEWLTHNGFQALRHDSIFCSNSLDQAFTYKGDARRVFIILPKNGFHYTWYGDTYDPYQLNFNLTL